MVGYTDIKSQVSISNSEFSHNFGAVGGVIAVYNLVELNFTNNQIKQNLGMRGGVMFSNDISTNSEVSKIYFYDNLLENNAAIQ